jgi:hypothetical protein
MLHTFCLPNTFSVGRFWVVFCFSQVLLVLDCLTTVVILEVCAGVELNPIVGRLGLFNVTIYKLAANSFIGYVSYSKKFLWLLYVISLVFAGVVFWNFANILLVI